MMSHISKIQSQNIYKFGVEIKMKKKAQVWVWYDPCGPSVH